MKANIIQICSKVHKPRSSTCTSHQKAQNSYLCLFLNQSRCQQQVNIKYINSTRKTVSPSEGIWATGWYCFPCGVYVLYIYLHARVELPYVTEVVVVVCAIFVHSLVCWLKISIIQTQYLSKHIHLLTWGFLPVEESCDEYVLLK